MFDPHLPGSHRQEPGFALQREARLRPPHLELEVLWRVGERCYILSVTVPGPRIQQEEKESRSMPILSRLALKAAADPLKQDNVGHPERVTLLKFALLHVEL